MSRSKITFKEINNLASEYINSPTKRIEILEKIWASESGHIVVALLEKQLSLNPNELINWIKDYYYQKRMWRYRGRKMIITDPPALADDTEEIAKQVAGWNGEQRFTRRNTLTGATRNKTSTVSGVEYFGKGYSIEYGSSGSKPDKSITTKIRRKVFKRDNYTCQYCGYKGSKDELEVDNSAGDDFDALITCCTRCFSENNSK